MASSNGLGLASDVNHNYEHLPRHTSNIYLSPPRYNLRMDVRQLRYFLTVVHERSVSRAAERLAMTQPPLSAAIGQLEKELGVRLLERHARGVDPTEAGEFLAREAAQLLDRLQELTEMTRGIGTGRMGRLTVAATVPMGWEVLPRLLRTFDRSSSGVETELIEAGDAQVIDQVRDGVADAGLLYCTRTADLERVRGREVEAALIRREPVVALVPSGSPYAEHELVDLTALGTDRWIVPSTAQGIPGVGRLVRDSWAKAGLAPESNLLVDSLATAVRLVAAGMGVTMAPSSVSSVVTDDVAVVHLTQALPPLEAVVVWRANHRPSPALQRFLRAALSAHEPDQLGPAVARSALRP